MKLEAGKIEHVCRCVFDCRMTAGVCARFCRCNPLQHTWCEERKANEVSLSRWLNALGVWSQPAYRTFSELSVPEAKQPPEHRQQQSRLGQIIVPYNGQFCFNAWKIRLLNFHALSHWIFKPIAACWGRTSGSHSWSEGDKQQQAWMKHAGLVSWRTSLDAWNGIWMS